MATGSGVQPNRGITVSNITPQVDLRTGDAEVWDEVRRVGARLSEAAKPNLIRRAQARGAKEGAALASGEELAAPGLLERVFSGGEVHEARIAARGTSYNAQIRNDIDAREAELRRAHSLDPEAYKTKADEIVSGFIQGAPPEYAVEVEAYARDRVGRGFEAVANARSSRDDQETVQALATRVATLDERLLALASQPDGMDSPEYKLAEAERSTLQIERENNPSVLYSTDQRLADDDKLTDGVLTANVSRLAVESYTDGGGGLAGYAAGARFLNEEVLQGEAFKDMSPERRRRVHRDAVAQLRDFSAADREEKRVQDEQERQAAAARRETVGDYRLRILLGEVGEDAIRGDASLTDGDKAALVAASRAQARREASDARRDAALEAANARGAYRDLRDDATGGTLTAGEIADALNAGTITAGQARTLGAHRDRALKPVIDGVMGPVRDAARGPGMSVRGTAVPMAQAEAHAANWARANPNATLQEQQEFGRVVAGTVFRAPSAGRPATQQQAQQEQAAALASLAAERTRRQQQNRPMSTPEYNRRRNEIIHGR